MALVWGYNGGMARVNVYLPDDLAARVKAADLNVSQITQEALWEAVKGAATDKWLNSLGVNGTGPKVGTTGTVKAARGE